MLLFDAASVQFCTGTAKVWQLVGNILFIFKIVVPILLIIFGMMDLGRAVVGAKDDEIKKAAKSLAMRAIAGVFIFLVPTLVGFIFGIVGDFKDVETDYNTCATCISKPSSCPVK